VRLFVSLKAQSALEIALALAPSIPCAPLSFSLALARSIHALSFNLAKSIHDLHKYFTQKSRLMTRRTTWLARAAIAGALIAAASPVIGQHSVARLWNDQMTQAIVNDVSLPPLHTRNYFHASAAMFDAWAAYDGSASQIFYHQKLTAPDIAAAQAEAISYAAYGVIKQRFVSGPHGSAAGRAATMANIRQQMTTLGYDPDNSTTAGDSPAAVGNRIAQAVIAHGLSDGSNEANDYAMPPGYYTPDNAPLKFTVPGTVMNDPSHWQPLLFTGAQTDKVGKLLPGANPTQTFLAPHWRDVTPFGMTAADRSPQGVYHDQGPPPVFGDALLREEARQLVEFSASLDPSNHTLVDMSPASRGNKPLGSFDEVGYAVNPVTGLPYAPQMVREGDLTRSIAEFWRDPPTQWNIITNYVFDRMDAVGVDKRIGGAGPVVDDLEWDVKGYLAVNGALHDAGIAAWDHKVVYDSARPISMVRYLGGLGQSTDPSLQVDLGGGNFLNTYNPNGLPLVPGLIEVITPATTAPGERHAHLAGFEGKVAVKGWLGPVAAPGQPLPFTNPADVGGVGWIPAESWLPFQIAGHVTPGFPGYVSGHATFSRSAADVLALLTGSEYFPGGLGEFVMPQGAAFLTEYGPSQTLTMQWAKFTDASDDSSVTRVYGGVHPAADGLAGRKIGIAIAPEVWALALRYFNGQVVPEPSSALLAFLVAASVALRRRNHVTTLRR